MHNEFMQVMKNFSVETTRINVKRVDDFIKRSAELGIEKEHFEDPVHTAWKLRIQDPLVQETRHFLR